MNGHATQAIVQNTNFDKLANLPFARDDNRQLQSPDGFGEGHNVVIKLSDRDVPAPRNQADLMVDQNESGVLSVSGS
jgi:hypothetical protein